MKLEQSRLWSVSVLLISVSSFFSPRRWYKTEQQIKRVKDASQQTDTALSSWFNYLKWSYRVQKHYSLVIFNHIILSQVLNLNNDM